MSEIGKVLVEKGIISSKQLNVALEQQHRTKESLGKILVHSGWVKEEVFLQILSQQLRMEFYPKLSDDRISKEAVKQIPIKLVWHYKFMPLRFEEDILVVAISDPFNPWLAEGIKTDLGCKVKRVLAPEKEVMGAIKKYYGVGADTVERILKDTSQQKEPVSIQQESQVQDLGRTAEDASVIKLVNQILSEAIKNRATDIHLEPYRDSVRLRQRIDGVLYNMDVPLQIKYLYPAMISRIKIISGLDVIERRLPQDGRAKVKVADKEIDLRISVLPSPYGENIVIRILPTQLLLNLSGLGFLTEDLEKLRAIIRKSHGIIFLTGPTGSGKTTTLYASLTEINTTAVKIITIEDPVEYELKGITQIQIKPKIGLTFASALRSILRHDPDVMMVGEVRDPETAELAIRSSLTGHLVFSTLHTNNAASGVARLLDMNIEPYLVASSVETIISQRLVRRICPKCKTKVATNKYQREKYNLKDFTYEGKGCQACSFTGFLGRTVIYEMLKIDEQIKELILKRASTSEIEQKTKELGLKTLKKSGLKKVEQGTTTLNEVMRVVELE